VERFVMAQLEAWKTSPRRKPLVLLGARQVGKTWLLKEFGARHYDRTVYVSLDESQIARAVFDGDLGVARILADLATLDGRGPIDPAHTLVILDEVQEAPRALASLKYFAENAPAVHVACAGSLLGVAAHQGQSFPVGKVNLIAVQPCTFGEFLAGIGEGALADLVAAGEPERFAPFHDTLVAALRQYFYVGGMPEAVVEYARERDLVVAREVQRELLAAYDRDFSKHAPLAEVPRLRALFDSVPRQLARENKRFTYAHAQPGARSKTMEVALQWLLDAGLVHRVDRIQVPRLPLASYAEGSAFKLYGLDVGLMAAAVGLEGRTLLDGSAAFTEYKGALAEQFVLQELVARGSTPYYWTSRSGAAEVDFVTAVGDDVLPIEVKAETNVQAKSLRLFRDEYAPRRCVRLSLRPYRDEGWVINVPLYAAARLTEMGR
jgi:predicted AAA+ superfamily ATPase